MNIRKLDRRLLTILLIVFVQMVGASMILPILPLYAQREFAMSPQFITLLAASFFAGQFVAGPYLGRLSDKIGRLPVLIVSQIGTAISFLMLALAPNVGTLFAARILDGITGGNIIVAQAYVTDITPSEKRTESLGYIMAAFGVSFFVGPALGGLLAAGFGPRIPYLIAAGAATITVLITWFVLDESLTKDQLLDNRSIPKATLSTRQLLQNRSLVLVLITGFLGQFAFGLLPATFSLYGEAVLFPEASEETVNIGIGLLLATVGLAQLITQVALLRPLLKQFGDLGTSLVGIILRAIGFLLLAAYASPWLAAIASILFASGMGLLMPTLQSVTTKTVDDSVRGGILGIYQSVTSVGTIISTAIAGTLFAFSPFMPYWVGVGLSILMLIPALLLMPRLQLAKPEPDIVRQ
ncbi:MAG: MFS transporter [Chloroflexota bacterium]